MAKRRQLKARPAVLLFAVQMFRQLLQQVQLLQNILQNILRLSCLKVCMYDIFMYCEILAGIGTYVCKNFRKTTNVKLFRIRYLTYIYED